MVEELELWSEFNVAIVGAAAALAGLVIVAASVNIKEIIAARTLTARLAAAIAALVLALMVSALGLVPAIGAEWYGWIVVACTIGAGIFQVNATRVIATDPATEDRARFAKSVLGFLPIAAYLAAGGAVLLGHPSGLYLAAAGGLVAITATLLVSWIVLVEVLR
ncbi:hypothetical protein [Microbacterium sp.]|uniref:hypothetical protein n=1 Tax=Microbacterium sp. TaxID=51671 RepID=UPI002E3022A6|nr:hypothetical protein [Microbacterium sp.]HEX5728026.1 hypothetical protein [Microbacterium sp.]